MKGFMRWGCLAVLGVLMNVGASAQVDEIKRHPGYVNLEWVLIPEHAERVMDMTIGPRLMKVAEEMAVRRHEEAAEEIDRIVSLQVKTFNVDSSFAEKMRPMMSRMELRLKDENWCPIIRVKNRDQFTNVSIKYDRSRKMEGFFIMSLDPRSGACFVNILGEVDLEGLKQVLVNFNENAMDSLKKSIEANRKTLENMRKTRKK